MCRLYDNSPINKNDIKKAHNIVEQIRDRTLDFLEKEGIFIFPELLKEAEDVTKDQKVIISQNNELRTTNIMGFLGYGSGASAERLVISSRFSEGETNDYLLQYLLQKVMGIPNLISLNTGTNLKESIFEIFEFIFPYYLKNALRKGLFKTYIRNEYNECNVKGAIDFARHIRVNTPFIGKIAFSQREFSYDNPLMELVRHTIEYIRSKSYGKTILNRIKDECRIVVEATNRYQLCDRQKIIYQNQKKSVRHAYFHEYKKLQELCLLILTHQKIQFSNENNNICGVLFDGAWLWEEYINTLISDLFHHPRNKAKNGNSDCQWLFTDENNIKNGQIYPDFISRKTDTIKSRVIGDAKYKRISGIGNKDYLQMLAYMFRFDSDYGLYFFPYSKKVNSDSSQKEDELQNNKSYFLNQGDSFNNNVEKRKDPEICLKKIGIVIPSNSVSYDDFIENIKSSEKKFFEDVSQLCLDKKMLEF